jgi:hypothetical protein
LNYVILQIKNFIIGNYVYLVFTSVFVS